MLITVQFTNRGTPATGLTPSISGWDLSDDTLQFNETMSETPGGIYKWDFSNYNHNVDYSFLVDGGDTLDEADRWQWGGNELGEVMSELEIIAGLVQRNQRITNCTYGTAGELLSATLTIYQNSTDATNQNNPITSFSLTATYDGNGNMTDYLVKEN